MLGCAVNGVNKVGEAAYDDELGQGEVCGVGQTLQLLVECWRVGLVVGQARFGQSQNIGARHRAATPESAANKLHALGGIAADVITVETAVFITNLIRGAAGF